MKDILGFVSLFAFLIAIVIFAPNYLGEPDNFIAANPMRTPPHIIPEWYFLFSYCALRSIPNKLGGVLALFSSLLILLALPLVYDCNIKGRAFNPVARVLFWTLVIVFILITFIGIAPVEEPYASVGLMSTLLYFLLFSLLSKVSSSVEKLLFSV